MLRIPSENLGSQLDLFSAVSYILAMINYQLIIIAVALGCDAFSVAIGVGAQGVSGRRLFRLSFHFALFQFLMPLVGLVIGQYAATILGTAAAWVAAVSLGVIGFRMAKQALECKSGEIRRDSTRGWTLILLSISTSVDALIVGFSLGLLGLNILFACLVIGLTAGLMTMTGMLVGAGAAKGLGRWAEFGGGILLMALAVWFVV
jgi:putative Mn2+ efflux pump MntP